MVHQSFYKKGGNPVLLLPIGSQPVEAGGKHAAGQIADVGQNQKPTVIDHLLEGLSAPFVVPADPFIPCLHPPGRTGKLDTANHLSFGPGYMDQILNPCPKGHGIPQVMVSTKEFFEQISLILVLNPVYFKGCKLFDAAAESAEGHFARTFRDNFLKIGLTFSSLLWESQHSLGF